MHKIAQMLFVRPDDQDKEPKKGGYGQHEASFGSLVVDSGHDHDSKEYLAKVVAKNEELVIPFVLGAFEDHPIVIANDLLVVLTAHPIFSYRITEQKCDQGQEQQHEDGAQSDLCLVFRVPILHPCTSQSVGGKKPQEIIQNPEFHSCLPDLDEDILEGPVRVVLRRQQEHHQRIHDIESNEEEEPMAIAGEGECRLRIDDFLRNGLHEAIGLDIYRREDVGHEDKPDQSHFLQEVEQVGGKCLSVGKETHKLNGLDEQVGSG